MKNFNIGNTDMRPNAKVPDGFLFIDTTINKLCYSKDNIWYDSLGNIANLSKGNSNKRPENVNIGYQFYDTTLNKTIQWSGNNWLEYDSEIVGIKRSGPFSDKPTPSNVGFQYFNTDTHKMITWDGSKWWNPDGTEATS